MTAEDEPEHYALLLNLVLLCLVSPASAYLSFFGVTHLYRSLQRTAFSRTDFGDDRKCFGWPYLKLLAATGLILGFCFDAAAWYRSCVSPAWMRGYRKRSAANVMCRVNFELEIFFSCSAYLTFLCFWLERLIYTFQGAALTQISTRCVWILRVPILFGFLASFAFVAVDVFSKGSIVDLKTTDVNPFKGSNKHPTICVPMKYTQLIISLAVVLIVLENVYLGHAYYTRLKATFAMSGVQQTEELAYVRRVAVLALFSVCSTLVCFLVELFVKPVAFFIATDVVINSLCVVASFKFGRKHYQLFCACFEPICHSAAVDSTSSVALAPAIERAKSHSSAEDQLSATI